jgi:hypothetical protein
MCAIVNDENVKYTKTRLQRLRRDGVKFILLALLLVVGCQKYSKEDYEKLKADCEVYENNSRYYQQEVRARQNELSQVATQRAMMENEIKFAKGKLVYFLTVEISKSSFTLSISQHIADAANAVEWEIPVDKDFYDAVHVGQTLNESFNAGSFWMKGKFSSNNIKVIGKHTKDRGKQ